MSFFSFISIFKWKWMPQCCLCVLRPYSYFLVEQIPWSVHIDFLCLWAVVLLQSIFSDIDLAFSAVLTFLLHGITFPIQSFLLSSFLNWYSCFLYSEYNWVLFSHPFSHIIPPPPPQGNSAYWHSSLLIISWSYLFLFFHNILGFMFDFVLFCFWYSLLFH